MKIREYLLKEHPKQLAIFVVLALVVFWLWTAYSSDDLTERILEILKFYSQKNNLIAESIFLLLMVLSVILGPFTAVPFVPFGILIWGAFETYLLILSGWLLGGVFAYYLGKTIGYPLVVKIMSREKIDMWRKFVDQNVNFFSAFLFRLAMPAETGYIFGLSGYSFGNYLLIIIIIEIPLAIATVWTGNALINKNLTVFIGLITAIAVIIGGAGYYLYRNRKHKK